MIKMLRIDERLIHGQVAISWSKVLKITHIVLINDEVAKNEMQKMALKMAVPSNVKFVVRDVEGGIDLLNDPRTKKMTIMVVVNNPRDTLVLARNVKEIELINIGNYGLLPGSQSGKSQKELATCVRVDENDINYLKQISSIGIKFEAQLTPDATKKDMHKILKGE